MHWMTRFFPSEICRSFVSPWIGSVERQTVPPDVRRLPPLFFSRFCAKGSVPFVSRNIIRPPSGDTPLVLVCVFLCSFYRTASETPLTHSQLPREQNFALFFPHAFHSPMLHFPSSQHQQNTHSGRSEGCETQQPPVVISRSRM